MSTLDEFHQEKDRSFKASAESPLSQEQQNHFTGLAYFLENEQLRFVVQPEKFTDQQIETIQLSSGATVDYLRWGKAAFTVNGQQIELTLYRDAKDGELFLAFKYATAAGAETYGGGRYLEPHELDDGSLVLDFNYTYNPYCAYNDSWACPLPPPENQLSVRIEAGEKSFSIPK